MKKIIFIIVFITMLMTGLVSSAAIKNHWSNYPDLFPAVSGKVVMPDSMIKLENSYINPKFIVSVSIISEVSAEIVTANNVKFKLLFERPEQTAEFINATISLMK